MILLGSGNLKFVNLNIGYYLSKFQNFWLSGSSFMEVSVRPPKHHYDVIITSFLTTEFPKLAYFVEHDIGYQPTKFQYSRMFGSNFMEVEWTSPPPPPPPPVLQRDKKPNAYKVKMSSQSRKFEFNVFNTYILMTSNY